MAVISKYCPEAPKGVAVTSNRTRSQTADFRRDEVAYIMRRWRAMDSCSLVGVGSVGKSNLLQHITQAETIKRYLPDTSDNFKAINIDPNVLGPIDELDTEKEKCWAGYELMMHRLFMSFFPFDMLPASERTRFMENYEAFQDGSNPLYAYMGLRYFEFGLDILFRQGIKIVFMFDEFEDMLKRLPVKFFQTLRGVRDANKQNLSYLTFTRAPLPILVDRYEIDSLGIEPFTELFNDNLLFVGPYNEKDARDMVMRLISRNNNNYPEPIVQFLIWATGGYAGLLRSAFRMLDSLGASIETAAPHNLELANRLAAKRAVQNECRTIWLSLTPPEQHVLKAAARLVPFLTNPETEQAVTMLVQKKLLHADRLNQTLEIEPPVFKYFVGTDPDEIEE